MNKVKAFLSNQLKLSVYDISLAGVLIAVWIIVNRFLTLDFGMMQAGITYAIAISVGLYFKPLLSVIIAIIADTISLAISNGGIGFWMWQYAITYPLLVLFVGLLKKVFSTKNEKAWWVFVVIAFAATMIGAILVAVLKDGFVKISHNGDNAFDFSLGWAKALIWSLIGLMSLFFLFISIIYLKKKNANIKKLITIYSIVSIVIVLFIWVWGPYADIKYLQKFGFSNKSFDKLYPPALFVRILKTPIILPLYTAIVYPLYKAKEVIFKSKSSIRWK